jgi:hypothetical protein
LIAATDLWLGDDGVAATVARASRSSADAVAKKAAADAPTGRLPGPRRLLISRSSWRVPVPATAGSDFLIDGGLIKTL